MLESHELRRGDIVNGFWPFPFGLVRMSELLLVLFGLIGMGFVVAVDTSFAWPLAWALTSW